MGFLMFAAVLIFVCSKKHLWENWKEYYSTILYLFIGSVVCHLLSYQKPLWDFSMLFYQYPVLNITLTSVLYPSTVILFLSFYPKTITRKILYNLLWIALYSGVEYLSFLCGDFIYLNGWNIYYTTLFNTIMFPMIRLHYKKPLLTWPISAALAFLLLWFFHIPLSRY
jgi:hypothetical protein